MFRVINNYVVDEQTLQYIPGEEPPPGVMVTIDAEQRQLDAEQRPEPFVKLGTTVRVHRPDGTSIDRIVTGVEIWGPHVGLYFAHTAQHEIPISSDIELLP